MAGRPRTADRAPAATDRRRVLSASPGRWLAFAVPDRVWTMLALILGLWVAHRLGAFHLWATVMGPDGVPVRVPDTFAAIDHPFHAARAETLRLALADAHPLRWVAHHQGGYPVEFYPLGVAWLEVTVWALTFGAVPIMAAHKLVVVAIFLLPGLAYALMARRDGWPLLVALAALAAHVAVPGGDLYGAWDGGYAELVQWGLVTNVAASVALLFVLAWLTEYLVSGSRPAAAGAALAAAFAISTNPRSLVALAVVGAGTWLALAFRPDVRSAERWRSLARLVIVGAVAALAAAPELVSLLRFDDLYHFVRYSSYEDLGAYLHASNHAVSTPVFVLGLGGVVIGLSLPARPVTRAAAVTLTLYVTVTAFLSAGPDSGLVPQLEATRLMPFQRLLTVYLAAVALHLLARWLVRAGRAVLRDALQAAAVGLLLLAYVGPADWPTAGWVAADQRGLYPVETTAVPATAEFEAAVEAADAAAPAGTALLVLGSELSWHQQLWAPFETDHPLYYDNWLWYWHTRHAGPYDYRQGHAYDPRRVGETVQRPYLDRHAIGAVVATEDFMRLADGAPDLDPVERIGRHAVYAVRNPTPFATISGGTATVERSGDQALTVRVEGGGGTVRVRRNWFPRWRAEVDGRSVPIARTDDGYMAVEVPPGSAILTLTYAVDGVDWLARLMCILGLGAALLLLIAGRAGWSGPRPLSRTRVGSSPHLNR